MTAKFSEKKMILLISETEELKYNSRGLDIQL